MLTAIVLLPLLGFVLNGILATRLGGNVAGNRFVTVVGCGLPIASFAQEADEGQDDDQCQHR